jgi:hypothetical protein
MQRPSSERARSIGSAAAWVFAPLLATLAVVALIPAAFHARLPDVPPLRQRWMATPTTVERLRAIDAPIAALYFDRRGSYVLGGGLDAATATDVWASEQQFERDLAARAIDPSVRYVMYDPEWWAATPLDEQRHPVAAMVAFAAAARSAGYGVIITPHPSLVEVPKADCMRSATETMEAGFLRCGIEAAAARLSDVVEVQGQLLEADPATYRSFVEAETAQARLANPNVVVLAGLSTRFASGPETLLNAWDSVTDIVDGHYMAVPEGIRPDIAVAFLRMLAEQRG